jgi:hypothetical protein
MGLPLGMSSTKLDDLWRNFLGRSIIAECAVRGVVQLEKRARSSDDLRSLHIGVHGNNIAVRNEAFERHRFTSCFQFDGLKLVVEALVEVGACTIDVGARDSNGLNNLSEFGSASRKYDKPRCRDFRNKTTSHSLISPATRLNVVSVSKLVTPVSSKSFMRADKQVRIMSPPSGIVTRRWMYRSSMGFFMSSQKSLNAPESESRSALRETRM